MSSIYDDELISYLKISKVKGYRIIEEVEEETLSNQNHCQ